MKRLFFLLTLFFYSLAYSQDLSEDGRQEDPDMDALRKWIREKRLVTVKEIGGDLSLSGEVRFEFQTFNEKLNGIQQRGYGSPTTKPDYEFDIEVNVMIDYNTERSWASIKLEFDNDMGTNSGTTNRLALEKAYFGGRMIDGDTFAFDGELGRRNLSDIFDSKIEFSSLFDGALLKFNKGFESIGNFYVNLGGFLIDDYFKHFGGVGELGMLKIANTGLFFKYSFITWKRHYTKNMVSDTDDREAKNRRYDFGNSQIILGYQGTIYKAKKYLKIYLAGLVNHFANRLPFVNTNTDNKYKYAWYAGISIGRILRAGDWALDMNYQYVMPQAIPSYDVGGIKRGNAQRQGFYTTNVNGTGDLVTDQANAVGNANYKGFQFELLYAISNNLTILQNFEISNNQTKNVGPDLSLKKYEMEFIYAF